MIELVDSHAHLQEQEFEADRAQVLQRAREAGVAAIVVPGVDLETSRSALRLAGVERGVFAAAGYHPHEASALTAGRLAAVEGLLNQAAVVAVGEIGLDYYRLHSPRAAQIQAFEAQLALAARLGRPAIVHCRDAWTDMDALLPAWARAHAHAYAGRPLGVLHYFSAGLEAARRYAELGFLISIHTSVTHPRAEVLREVAAGLPLDCLLVETDSPYGAPQTQRGRRNEPAYVAEAARQIAALRGLSLEDVAAATTANARRLFGLPAANGLLKAGSGAQR